MILKLVINMYKSRLQLTGHAPGVHPPQPAELGIGLTGRCGAPILAGDLSGGLECGEEVEVDTRNLTYP